MPDGYGGGQIDPQVLQMILALAGRKAGEDSNITGPGIGQLNQADLGVMQQATQNGLVGLGAGAAPGAAAAALPGQPDPYAPIMSPPPMTPPPEGLY